MTDLDYETTISEETKKIAEKELREDENSRRQSLDAFRNWIVKNPRIESCRMDANFLLRFLRFKKFSVPQAQEALERYLLLRQCYQIGFRNLNIKIPAMYELLRNGFIFAVPKRDKLGRRILIGRIKIFDPHRHANFDMCRVTGIVGETIMEDEENQVRGCVYLGDGDGVAFPYMTIFTPKEAVRIAKNGERTVPMRHKEMYALNVPSSLKYAVDFGLSLVTEKIRKRVKICSNIEEVHGYIDKSLLPKEYGGEMPISEMVDLFMKEIEAMQPQILAHDHNLKVHEEMYTESQRVGAVSALRAGANHSCYSQDMMNGTFRKLQVD